jgi:hypothetical protein
MGKCQMEREKHFLLSMEELEVKTQNGGLHLNLTPSELVGIHMVISSVKVNKIGSFLSKGSPRVLIPASWIQPPHRALHYGMCLSLCEY